MRDTIVTLPSKYLSLALSLLIGLKNGEESSNITEIGRLETRLKVSADTAGVMRGPEARECPMVHEGVQVPYALTVNQTN